MRRAAYNVLVIQNPFNHNARPFVPLKLVLDITVCYIKIHNIYFHTHGCCLCLLMLEKYSISFGTINCAFSLLAFYRIDKTANCHPAYERVLTLQCWQLRFVSQELKVSSQWAPFGLCANPVASAQLERIGFVSLRKWLLSLILRKGVTSACL